MNLYEILGVAKDATPGEIKYAYRRQAQKNHPDKDGDTERFQEITNAWKILGNTIKRKRYDETGLTAEEESLDTAIQNKLLELFSSLIDAGPLEDIIKAGIRQVNSVVRGIEDRKQKLRGLISKLTPLQGRVLCTDETNFYECVLNERISGVQGALDGLEKEQEIAEGLLEALKNYTDDSPQPRAAPTYTTTKMPFGILGGSIP